MLLFIAILSALPIDTTSTRAVVRYTAPSDAPCSMRVSPDADFSTLHADVDPRKFPGSNLDAGGPRERTWVIGHPGRWFVTAGGDIESRALRAAYRYYGEIACEGQAERFEFETRTVPFGNVYEEVLPPLEPGGAIMPTVPEGKDRWWGAHPVTGAYFGFPLALRKDLGKPVGFDQVDGGYAREHGWENEDGWSLVYGNGAQAGGLIDFGLYAVRERGRELDINLYDGSAFANSPLGGTSLTAGPRSIASNWSRGGAGPDSWRTRYHQVQRRDGTQVLVKGVFEKSDPENPRSGPLTELFGVLAGAVKTTALANDLQSYVRQYADAHGLPYYGRPGLRHIQGSIEADIAVLVDSLGNQDSPGVIYALDLGNGEPCGSGWRSSIDGGDDCRETDNTGLVVAGWDPYRGLGATRWTPIHGVEPDLTQGVPYGRLILNGQSAKLRQFQPTYQTVLAAPLPAVAGETPDQTITVTSELPVGAEPSCDLVPSCGVVLDTTGPRATCNGSCGYHLGVGYTVHAVGEARVVEAVNPDGSVTLNAPFSRDLDDEAYTFDVAAPSWWSPGCPVSGSHFAGRGGDHPMFNRCIEPGDVAFLSPRHDGLDYDQDAERVAVSAVMNNGDGTWTLTVTRHLSSTNRPRTGPYQAGAVLSMAANWWFAGAGSVSCDFRNDPDCSESGLHPGCVCHTSTVVSKSDESKSIHLGAGGAFFEGSPENMPSSPTWKWDTIPAFAGARAALGVGNSSQKHPQLPGADPAFDRRATDNHHLMGGAGTQNNSAIEPVAGYERVYRVNEKFYPKRIGIIAFDGRHRYAAKSEPGAQLTDEDDHRFCPVVVENDCVPGSKPGELYIASSDLSQQFRYCLSTEKRNDASLNIPCIQPMIPFANSVMEYWARDGVDDLGGRYGRALIPQISGWTRGTTVFSHVQYVGNEGRWGTWPAPDETTGGHAYGIVEFPPLPRAEDVPSGPLTFLPVRVQIAQAPGAAAAYVQFGYGREPGRPFLCRPYTVERDCFAVGSEIDESDPFQWEGQDFSGRPFVEGKASIAIPALPDRVLFYRVIQTDAAGAVVHTGPTVIGASEKLAGWPTAAPAVPRQRRSLQPASQQLAPQPQLAPRPQPRRLRRQSAQRSP